MPHCTGRYQECRTLAVLCDPDGTTRIPLRPRCSGRVVFSKRRFDSYENSIGIPIQYGSPAFPDHRFEYLPGE